jgi:hypothetical protein
MTDEQRKLSKEEFIKKYFIENLDSRTKEKILKTLDLISLSSDLVASDDNIDTLREILNS